MPTDYQRIADENVRKYGTDIGRYGPTLLAHLYTERTHFVYELLQNAEDALARRAKAEGGHSFSKRVSFHLRPDRLEFRHFGQPFDEADDTTATNEVINADELQELEKAAGRTTQTETRQARLETRVYVEAVVESESRLEAKSQAEKRNATGRTGVQKVLEYERKQNRNPQDKSDEKLGYDIESTGLHGSKRFIEVKSVSGDWDALGVGMTAPEFHKAQELAEQYWLYVVERAGQNDFKIYPIQNPAHLVNQFFYDKGWKALAGHRIDTTNELQ